MHSEKRTELWLAVAVAVLKVIEAIIRSIT